MNYREKSERLNYLLDKIEKGNLSDIEQVAKSLNCSKRTIARMISELKFEGNEIKFCKISNKYFIKNYK